MNTQSAIDERETTKKNDQLIWQKFLKGDQNWWKNIFKPWQFFVTRVIPRKSSAFNSIIQPTFLIFDSQNEKILRKRQHHEQSNRLLQVKLYQKWELIMLYLLEELDLLHVIFFGCCAHFSWRSPFRRRVVFGVTVANFEINYLNNEDVSEGKKNSSKGKSTMLDSMVCIELANSKIENRLNTLLTHREGLLIRWYW